MHIARGHFAADDLLTTLGRRSEQMDQVRTEPVDSGTAAADQVPIANSVPRVTNKAPPPLAETLAANVVARPPTANACDAPVMDANTLMSMLGNPGAMLGIAPGLPMPVRDRTTAVLASARLHCLRSLPATRGAMRARAHRDCLSPFPQRPPPPPPTPRLQSLGLEALSPNRLGWRTPGCTRRRPPASLSDRSHRGKARCRKSKDYPKIDIGALPEYP